ncbi:MAG: PP2C family protein-serine/threonine phosphatase [Solirubrobacterales bacterium]
MVGDANGRARRALAVAIVGCGVFGLQALPTAAAAKDGARSTASSGGEGTAAAAAARRAEHQAAKAAGAPAPPVVAAPSGEASAPPAAATRAQHREERRQARRSTSTSATTGSGASPAVVVTGDESSAGQAEAFARKQKKGGGGGKGKKEHKEKGKKPQEEGSGGEGSGTEGSSAADAKGKGSLTEAAPLAQVSATSASLAPAAVAPASGTTPASVSSVPSAGNAGRAGGAAAKHTGRHAARRARKSFSGAIAAAVSVGASPLLAAQSGASAATPSRASHTGAKRSQQSSTQPALVRTFTKIVGVVPTPVRILIGALILLALMLGVRSLLGGARTRRLVRQRRQLLEDVGLLQAALLPVPPARLGPVATSVAYRPADGPGAGGDFYDVFALEDGEIAVIVGDVSGHGREALPHTALLRFTVRAYLEAGLSPRKALQTAGNVLDRQLAGSFATVVAATYNPRERKLTYASAGHPPPVMLGDRRDAGGAEAASEGEGAARPLAPVISCSAPPVGAGMRTGTRQTVVSVPGPARLCFHTDGVTEARIGDDLFGAERLAAALSGLQPDADAAALLDRVAERSDARPDDMAACLLRVHDGHGAPAIVLEQLECNRELLAGGRVGRFLLDCGVELGQAEALVRDARRRLERADSVLLELAPDADGRPIASLVDDNVIHTAALAPAGAS